MNVEPLLAELTCPVLLVVEPDAGCFGRIAAALAEISADFQALQAVTLDEGVRMLSTRRVDVVIASLGLPEAPGVGAVERLVAVSRAVPVIALTEATQEGAAAGAVQAGAQDYLLQDTITSPLLGRTIRHAIERHRLLMELEQAREREAYHATHDPLTGLPNRDLLFDRLVEALERAKRYGESFAVGFVDIDDLKAINDRHGRQAGDSVIAQLGKALTGSVRRSDTVARLAGDEFVLLIERIPNRTLAERVLNDAGRRAAGQITVGAAALPLTVSIGIAMFPVDGRDPEQLVRAADTACMARKRSRFQRR